jgi:hypothetical protein
MKSRCTEVAPITGVPSGVVASADVLAVKPELTGEQVADGMFRVQYA